VLDFGIAKLVGDDGGPATSAQLTAAGAVLGTPCYMAPEQFGERDVDVRADVWSLGMVAYHCLSGELPTQGAHVFEVFRKIADRPVPPLETVAPELPAEVTRLVGRMLARRRDDRPRDLREAAEVFSRVAGRGAGHPRLPRTDPRPGAGAQLAIAGSTEGAIDALATTYDSTLPPAGPTPSSMDAPAAVVPPSDGASAPAGQTSPPAEARASGRDRARRARIGAVVVAATLGSLWMAASPGARGLAATGGTPVAANGSVAPASLPAAGSAPPPSPAGTQAGDAGDIAAELPLVAPQAPSTAPVAPRTPVAGNPRTAGGGVHPVPAIATGHPSAAAASSAPAPAPSSAAASAPVPARPLRGGLVEEPPF
jgi:hypothetical protein